MTDSVGDFAFLPNLRASSLTEASREGIRLVAEYQVQVTGGGNDHGAAVPKTAVMKGPGDVIAINPDQIIRTEPEPGLRGVEPNYFPYVEFRDADLPWRYSLAEGEDAQLPPWIVLVVLRDDEFTFAARGTGPAPCISVNDPAASLPDLAQSWAFAHVQVDMNGLTGSDVKEVVDDSPSRAFSRLICPRQLDPEMFYTMFVLPAYAAGREAGLGGVPDSGLGIYPAWTGTETHPLVLPYYFTQRFRTGPNEDVEALLRRLRAVRADEADEAGAPEYASTSDLGYYRQFSEEAKFTFPLHAALAQPGFEPSDMETPDRLAGRMANTLNTVLAEQPNPDAEDEEDEDPLLTFPAHGAAHTGRDSVTVARARQGLWFSVANLDLKYRQAAGLGAEIVRKNQDRYAQLCWKQYDKLVAINTQLRQLELAGMLAGRLESRHFRALPSDVGLRASQPMLRHVTAPERKGSIAAALLKGGLPKAYTSRDLARQTARKPTRVESGAGGGGKGGAGRLRATPVIPGDRSPRPEAVIRKDSAVLQLSKEMEAAKQEPELTDALGTLYNREHLGRRVRPNQPQAEVRAFSSRKIQLAVGDRLAALPKAKADALIQGRSKAEQDQGGVVYRAPRIPEPLVNPLRLVRRDALLSNVAALPDNTVSAYSENRHFIEAVMLGANHAMQQELRWRGFPTDMKGTIFHRFWDRGAEPDDTSKDDIGPIHTWTGKLGNQDSPVDQDGEENIVVVIKGDVVRKLDNPLMVIDISANPDEWDGDPTGGSEPVFWGKIGRDVMYYGFDVSIDFLMSPANKPRAYFVIYEPPGRMRFGLDIGNYTVRRERGALSASIIDPMNAPPMQDWDDLSWAHMDLTASNYVSFDEDKIILKPPEASFNLWSAHKTSAKMARSFWQKPIAAVLPLERVL